MKTKKETERGSLGQEKGTPREYRFPRVTTTLPLPIPTSNTFGESFSKGLSVRTWVVDYKTKSTGPHSGFVYKNISRGPLRL